MLTFTQPEYLSAHLQEYLPGLSSVLSFASLSVRPALYSLFEDHIIVLPIADLRPALKSILLGLLPAIEEETAEDFDRAFKIVQSFEHKFSRREGNSDQVDERSGYFWQCLFLCVITSPSRRQGALNYLVRRLPRFSTSNSAVPNETTEQLSPEAEAATSPEPGLLVRCFIAGLSDAQTLIQRGFLDLLVTHLPLHSPVLRKKAEERDLDSLVSAAILVLLRREMSLNKRLWTWFLGPELGGGGQASPTMSQATQSAVTSESLQLRYFESYSKAPLERCVLTMFTTKASSASQLARSFRICLSLMDRWEIGGSVVPRVFLPSLDCLYAYSVDAPAQDVAEVLRSASLFFDGVEANLIWATLRSLLQRTAKGNDAAYRSVRLFNWIIENFNVKDEEMITIYAPVTALYFLSLLNSDSELSIDDDGMSAALITIAKLLDLVPPRVFEQQQDSLDTGDLPDIADDEICATIDEFYDSPNQKSSKTHMPFRGLALLNSMWIQASALTMSAFHNASGRSFGLCVPVLVAIFSKTSNGTVLKVGKLYSNLAAKIASANLVVASLPFPTVASTISFLAALQSKDLVTKRDVLQLQPALAQRLWHYVSPINPKYHIEAVKSFWQLDDLVAPEDDLKVSLLSFMRSASDQPNLADSNTDEVLAVRRFTALWTQTVPSQPSGSKAGAYGSGRRGSAVPGISDMAHAARHLDILAEPLLLALDMLKSPSAAASEIVKTWLATLPSLDQVYMIILQRLHNLLNQEAPQQPEDNVGRRHTGHQIRSLVYYFGLLTSILSINTDWIWECLVALDTTRVGEGDARGPALLARLCMRLLSRPKQSSKALDREVVSLLDTLISGPAAAELSALDFDSALIDRLIYSLGEEDDALQGRLLQLTPKTIRLRLNAGSPPSADDRLGTSLSPRRLSTMRARANGSIPALDSAPAPPPRLLHCIRLGFTSQSARFHMEQWLGFLANILPTFADAIFASLIPLVECLCVEASKVFGELIAMTKSGSAPATRAFDNVILGLLDALEMILARAHDNLLLEIMPDTPSKPSIQSNSFLGGVAPGVFKAEGPPSKTAQANSRLTVILAFQDSIRTCLDIWTWSSHSTEAEDFDSTSAATSAHIALRLRNKTRYLLEQMFSVEPLESLEVLVVRWRFAEYHHEAAAALGLLQVMQGSRPKNVIPAVLDALCSRTNPAALPLVRQSSQTVDITAVDVALFLLAYLRATEDDAMDEVWADCIAFLRDVLANPLPYRMVLSPLLSLVHLLARKVVNTNFGEQRKMRRELGDIFQRLLTATFTTIPHGLVLEVDGSKLYRRTSPTSDALPTTEATNLLDVLRRAVTDMEAVLETSERITIAVNIITSNVIAPAFRAKTFPGNISLEVLTLLLEVQKKAPNAKPWRKEVSDVLNDAKILSSPASLMEAGWLPVLHQWSLRDKDRMADLLSRLTPPSSAGIMFGVGASAARLEADRRTQLNLRRICLLLLASPQDAWIAHLRDFDEKLSELSGATQSSSPSSVVKAELFMLCMALVIALSPVQLSPLWPRINDSLQAALTSLYPTYAQERSFTNFGLLQACKLLDQLIALSPDEFQLHEWLYIADTVDAVYRPEESTITALADQIAETLGAGGMEDGQAVVPSPLTSNAASEHRRLLLDGDFVVDKDDVKALPRDEFATLVLRPFLSQLSIHAYEGVYSMHVPDLYACKRRILGDILDLGTIVE